MNVINWNTLNVDVTKEKTNFEVLLLNKTIVGDLAYHTKTSEWLCMNLFILLYFQGRPVEILPFLYLGSAYHACRQDYLSDLHITALLNVSRRDSRPARGQYDYKWIPVEDSHTADISSHFQEAIDFIGKYPFFLYLYIIVNIWSESNSFCNVLKSKCALNNINIFYNNIQHADV